MYFILWYVALKVKTLHMCGIFLFTIEHLDNFEGFFFLSNYTALDRCWPVSPRTWSLLCYTIWWVLHLSLKSCLRIRKSSLSCFFTFLFVLSTTEPLVAYSGDSSGLWWWNMSWFTRITNMNHVLQVHFFIFIFNYQE